jgi:hypothetical protein
LLCRNRIGGSGTGCGSSASRRRNASIATSPSNLDGNGGASLSSPPGAKAGAAMFRLPMPGAWGCSALFRLPMPGAIGGGTMFGPPIPGAIGGAWAMSRGGSGGGFVAPSRTHRGAYSRNLS